MNAIRIPLAVVCAVLGAFLGMAGAALEAASEGCEWLANWLWR